MGHVDKVLGKVITSKETKYYNDFFSIEVCENFHLHWRNMRLQFTPEEFQILASAMRAALTRWELLRKPYPYPETIYLIKPWGTLPKEQLFSDEIKIEQQVKNPNLPEIHFHYKNARIDLSKDELLELKKVFEDVK